ncbi:Opacity protein [Cetobacterium ceti]|uniref:Opacity protein n=1 Tax=Cetobacterium ceti TaxID=180163 RepID=A0A1T4MRM7_9FUSO|nr:outer membrane beta-barrel protein [Cetobacterium ceti]SJZ69454.1 Opacity protein [Cetobacterium ceti]
MKKFTFLLSSILILSTSVYAKEMMVNPMESKEVVEQPMVVEEVSTVVVQDIVPRKNKQYLVLKVGGDISPEYENVNLNGNKLNSKSAKNLGYEISLEFMQQLWHSNFEVGLGTAYQRHGGVKSINSVSEPEIVRASTNEISVNLGRYDSVPLYLIGKYNFGFWKGWSPYIKGDIGYSFNIKDHSLREAGESIPTKIDDGLYYGVGLGAEYYNWTVDAMYKVNKADIKVHADADRYSDNFDYSRVTLSVGYKFDL